MFFQLIRRAVHPSRLNNSGVTQKDLLERNMQIINDNLNYSLNRISRVIRAYYFLSAISPDTNWLMNNAVTTSILKVQRVVKSLDNESINTLIMNLGWLRIFHHSIWDELEILFITKSHFQLPAINISRVCDTFQSAGRKNADIWNILEDLLMKNVYASDFLKPGQISIAYRSFAMVNQGSEKLFSKFDENIKLHMDNFTIPNVIEILSGMKNRASVDPTIIDSLFSKAIVEIKKSNTPNYHNLLKLALFHNTTDERLSEIEKLFISSLNAKNSIKNLRIIYLYLTQDIEITSKRMEFFNSVVEFYLENEKNFETKDNFSKEIVEVKTSIIYLAIKFDIKVGEADVKNVFDLLEANQKILSEKTLEYKAVIESFLKERFPSKVV